MTPLIIGAVSLAGTGFVLGGGGRVAAKVKRGTLKFYDDNLRRKIGQWMGSEPPTVEFQKILGDGNGENLVFRIKNFSYYDIEKAEEINRYIKTLAEREPSLKELDEAREKAREKANTKKEESEEGKIIKKSAIKTFDIELTVFDKKTKVGEIDFENWDDEKKFKISIFRTGGGEIEELDVDDEDYGKVAKYIKKYAKTKSAELMPDQVANNAIRQAKGKGFFGAYGLRDRYSATMAKILPEALANLIGGDKTAIMEFETNAGKHPHLRQAAYIGALVKLASQKAANETKPGEKANCELIKNFFEVQKQEIKNELCKAQVNRTTYANEVKSRRKTKEEHNKAAKVKEKIDEAKKTASYVKIWGKRILIGGVSLIAIAGILALGSLFFPALAPVASFLILLGTIATTATGAAFGVIKGAFKAITGSFGQLIQGIVTPIASYALAAAGLTALITSIYFKGIPDYKAQCLEDAEKDLKISKEAEELCQNELDEVKEIENGIVATLEAINRFRNKLTPNKTLDLSPKELGHKIGSMGFACVCEHIPSIDLDFFGCEKLILRDSGIDSDKTIVLASILENAQKTPGQAKIQSLDIRENPIDQDGMEAIITALKENCTLTELNFTNSFKQRPFHPDIVKNIEKELLMNRFLQGIPLDADEEHIRKLFHPDDFKKKAEIKMKNNYSIIDYPTSPPLENSLAKKFVDQNKVFTKLREEVTPETASHYIAAFKIDRNRCKVFMDKKVIPKHNRKKIGIDEIRSLIKKQQEMITQAVLNNPIVLLENTNTKECEDILKSLPIAIKDRDKKIEIIGEILKNTSDKKPAAIKGELGNIIRFATTNKEPAEKFKERLRDIRGKIARKVELETEQKREILFAIDKACFVPQENFDYPEAEFIAYQLEETLKNPGPDLKQALEDVIYICKKIPTEELRLAFDRINNVQKATLIELVKKDIETMESSVSVIGLLNKGNRKLCLELLKQCGENSEKSSDIFASLEIPHDSYGIAMIASEMMLLIPELAPKYAKKLFSKPGMMGEKWTFDKYISELAKERDRETSEGQKMKINIVIQAGIQEYIKERLKKDVKSKEIPAWLIEKLEKSTELTQIEGFDFKKGKIDPRIQEYIKHICRRNNLIKKLNELKANSANTETIEQSLKEEQITYIARNKDAPIALKEIQGILQENEKITGFKDLERLNFPLKIKEYINFVLSRNNLSDIMKHPNKVNLEFFADIYKHVPENQCNTILKKVIEPKSLLDLIQTDLGEPDNVSFKVLSTLLSKPKHLIALLKHSFSVILVDETGLNEEPMEPEQTKKAILIAGLIRLLPELRKQNSKQSKYIMNMMLYWGLSTKGSYGRRCGVPYYKYKHIINGRKVSIALSGIESLVDVVQKMPTSNPEEQGLKNDLLLLMTDAKLGQTKTLKSSKSAYAPILEDTPKPKKEHTPIDGKKRKMEKK